MPISTARSAFPGSGSPWTAKGAGGAGRFAMQGGALARPQGSAAWPHSGQGGAFRQIGPTWIGVFTVVNALGAVVDRDGRMVRCARNDAERICPLISEALADRIETSIAEAAARAEEDLGPTSNTTLTLVVTNQKLGVDFLERLAKQVHGSMSRAIQPFATASDA